MRIFIKIRDFYRGIKRYIRNLVRWSPMLWQDNDFDHAYLYKVMLMKIKQMEKFWHSGKTWSMPNRIKKIQKELKICRILIERILDSNYYDSAAARYNVPSYGEKKEGIPRFKTLLYLDRVHYLEKQDKELLFSLISKYIDKWWD